MIGHLIQPVLQAVTIAAIAFPGVDWVMESVLEGFDAVGTTEVVSKTIEAMPEGAGKATASIAFGIEQLNEKFAELAAATGNAINLDALTNADKPLTAAHFTENFGIIPKTLQGIATAAPGIAQTALAEENRAVLLTGLGAGGVAMAMSPPVSKEVNVTITSGAQQAMQLARTATDSARQGLESASSFAQKITAQRAEAAPEASRGA